MNILLCWMVTMPIVCPTLKIDVMKMEQAIQMGYKESERAFYVSPQNRQGKTEPMINFVDSWSLLWKEKNEQFEAVLKVDLDKCHVCLERCSMSWTTIVGFKPGCHIEI